MYLIEPFDAGQTPDDLPGSILHVHAQADRQLGLHTQHVRSLLANRSGIAS